MKELKYILLISLLFLSTAVSPSFTENHWQVAFNKKVTQGQLEYSIIGGRVDILTEYHAIEVEKISTWQEGIKQALRYAKATNKRPGLALYIDKDAKAFEKFKKAKQSCEQKGIKLWLINEYVSINDIVGLSDAYITNDSETYESPSADKKIELNRWINTSSGVRHNSSCRWYKNTKFGKMSNPTSGRACKICGG